MLLGVLLLPTLSEDPLAMGMSALSTTTVERPVTILDVPQPLSGPLRCAVLRRADLLWIMLHGLSTTLALRCDADLATPVNVSRGCARESEAGPPAAPALATPPAASRLPKRRIVPAVRITPPRPRGSASSSMRNPLIVSVIMGSPQPPPLRTRALYLQAVTARWISRRPRTTEVEALGSYVSGSILTAIIGVMQSLAPVRPLEVRDSHKPGPTTAHASADRMCSPFACAVAAAATKGPAAWGGPVAVVARPPIINVRGFLPPPLTARP